MPLGSEQETAHNIFRVMVLHYIHPQANTACRDRVMQEKTLFVFHKQPHVSYGLTARLLQIFHVRAHSSFLHIYKLSIYITS